MIRFNLLLTPFASQHTVKQTPTGRENYSNYYVFGIRIIRLHRDK